MLGIILGAFENGKELRYRGEIQTETPKKTLSQTSSIIIELIMRIYKEIKE